MPSSRPPGPASGRGSPRRARRRDGIAGELTLIAVTKTYPASDVLALAGLGLTDFGENRDQEAAPKAAEVAAAFAAAGMAAPPYRGGGAGHLALHRAAADQQGAQRGQVRRRGALGGPDPAGPRPWRGGPRRRPRPDLPGAGQPRPGRRRRLPRPASRRADPARGGVPPARLAEVAAAIEAEPGLALGGLMAVAPLGMDPRARVRAAAPPRRRHPFRQRHPPLSSPRA